MEWHGTYNTKGIRKACYLKDSDGKYFIKLKNTCIKTFTFEIS